MPSDIICGINTVISLIQRKPEKILEIYTIEKKKNPRILQILDLATDYNIPVAKVKAAKIDALVNFARHQGVAAKIQVDDELNINNLSQIINKSKTPALILVLDGIQDPHNFGACLRTAAGAGVDLVIVPKDKAVDVTPTVRKIAAGGAEITPIIRVTNIARCLEKLKELGIWIVGTTPNTQKNIFELDLAGPIAMVLGAEGAGVRDLTLKHCDYFAKIPMQAEIESLNVSVATGICLFEVVRQRSL